VSEKWVCKTRQHVAEALGSGWATGEFDILTPRRRLSTPGSPAPDVAASFEPPIAASIDPHVGHRASPVA
jgi:hypothetical protein